jgi:hypothetical protein
VVAAGIRLGVAALGAPKFENSEPPSAPAAGVAAVVAAGVVVAAVDAFEPKSDAPSRGAGREPVSVDSGSVDERFNGEEPNKPPPAGAAEGFPKSDMMGPRTKGCVDEIQAPAKRGELNSAS